MADGTHIEWTDATVNAVNGCSVVSPGCTNCYAMRLAGTRLKHHPSRAGLTRDAKAGPVWTGEVRLNEVALLQPLRWKRPRRIFWNAHGDLFHEKVPDEWIDRVFAICALTPQHQHQILTKRPERMRRYLTSPYPASRWVDAARTLREGREDQWARLVAIHGDMSPLPNVWLGVSVEDQARADERIPHLLATPAAVRFLSCEPLLGPVDLTRIHEMFDDGLGHSWESCLNGKRYDPWSDGEIKGCPKIDWVIVGGESGPGARPMHPDWARSLRDQCAAACVPFFFKQWGEWRPVADDRRGEPEFNTALGRAQKTPAFFVATDGSVHCFTSAEEEEQQRRTVMLKVGKKAAGRLLDGVEHNGMPRP